MAAQYIRWVYMTDWDTQAGTYSYAARLRGWDTSAAAASVFRRSGYRELAPMDHDAALRLGEWVKSVPAVNEGVLRYADSAALLASAELRDLAVADDVMTEARMWLGAEPRLIDVVAWTSTPGPVAGAQGWHRDLDDWRACKVFVYLSDVDEEQGPHEMIPGSHREAFFTERGLAPERWMWGNGRAAEPREIGDWPRMVMTGPAGSRMLVNTFCYHRGRPVVSGERVVAQFVYGLTVYEHMRERMSAIAAAWGRAV